MDEVVSGKGMGCTSEVLMHKCAIGVIVGGRVAAPTLHTTGLPLE